MFLCSPSPRISTFQLLLARHLEDCFSDAKIKLAIFILTFEQGQNFTTEDISRNTEFQNIIFFVLLIGARALPSPLVPPFRFLYFPQFSKEKKNTIYRAFIPKAYRRSFISDLSGVRLLNFHLPLPFRFYTRAPPPQGLSFFGTRSSPPTSVLLTVSGSRETNRFFDIQFSLWSHPCSRVLHKSKTNQPEDRPICVKEQRTWEGRRRTIGLKIFGLKNLNKFCLMAEPTLLLLTIQSYPSKMERTKRWSPRFPRSFLQTGNCKT